MAVSGPAGLRARPGQRGRCNGPEIRGDGGQAAWITDAGAIALVDRPLYPGQTTQAGPLWPSGNFAAVKDIGSCSPPFMAEIAKALSERYEPG